MRTYNVSNFVKITSLKQEELNSFKILDGEAIHISQKIQESLTKENTQNQILETHGFVILDITKNINKFLNQILHQAPAHNLTQHRILIDESELQIVQQTQSCSILKSTVK